MEANYFTILYWFCHTSTIHSFLRFTEYLPDHLSGEFLFFTSFSFLRFCFVSLFGTYPSVSSFYLILCVLFYVLGRSVTFTNLWGVAFYRRCSVGPATHSLMVIRAICSRSVPYVVCLCEPFCSSGAEYCRCASGWGWLIAWWAARSILCPLVPGPLMGGAGSPGNWLWGVREPRLMLVQLVGGSRYPNRWLWALGLPGVVTA